MTGYMAGVEKATAAFEYPVGSPIGIERHRRRLRFSLCPSLMGIVTIPSSGKNGLRARCSMCKEPAKIDWGQEHINRIALYK